MNESMFQFIMMNLEWILLLISFQIVILTGCVIFLLFKDYVREIQAILNLITKKGRKEAK